MIGFVDRAKSDKFIEIKNKMNKIEQMDEKDNELDIEIEMNRLENILVEISKDYSILKQGSIYKKILDMVKYELNYIDSLLTAKNENENENKNDNGNEKQVKTGFKEFLLVDGVSDDDDENDNDNSYDDINLSLKNLGLQNRRQFVLSLSYEAIVKSEIQNLFCL